MKTEMPIVREDGFFYGIDQEEAYIATLRDYQRNRVNSAFMNDSIGHATLLADMMVGSAENYALIYSRCLCKQVYEFALANLPGSVKVRVLYDDILEEKDQWWKTLTGKDIVAHHIDTPPKFKRFFKSEDVHHFFVCDGEAVRYEISDAAATATANFNMPDVCRGLSKIFADHWEISSGTKLDLDLEVKESSC